MKDSQEQLQILTQQMSQLMQEKAELETRNKILEQVVRLNVEHVDQLQTNKACLTPSSSPALPLRDKLCSACIVHYSTS